LLEFHNAANEPSGIVSSTLGGPSFSPELLFFLHESTRTRFENECKVTAPVSNGIQMCSVRIGRRGNIKIMFSVLGFGHRVYNGIGIEFVRKEDDFHKCDTFSLDSLYFSLQLIFIFSFCSPSFTFFYLWLCTLYFPT
jgi:hypothetical protein